MTDKAQLERLTQLALAAQGKPTKRPVKDILTSERSAAEKYLTRSAPIASFLPPAKEGGGE